MESKVRRCRKKGHSATVKKVEILVSTVFAIVWAGIPEIDIISTYGFLVTV